MKKTINGKVVNYQELNGEKLCLIKDMSTATGINVETIRKWVQRDQIDFVRFGRINLIPLYEVVKRMGV